MAVFPSESEWAFSFAVEIDCSEDNFPIVINMSVIITGLDRNAAIVGFFFLNFLHLVVITINSDFSLIENVIFDFNDNSFLII